MSKRDDHLLLEGMLEAAKKISEYTKGFAYNDFIDDNKTVDAVIRNFEIIGEAASRVDISLQSQFEMIPWRLLKGYRNRLVHEYFGVDFQIVWDIITDDLPDLKTLLREVKSSKKT